VLICDGLKSGFPIWFSFCSANLQDYLKSSLGFYQRGDLAILDPGKAVPCKGNHTAQKVCTNPDFKLAAPCGSPYSVSE